VTAVANGDLKQKLTLEAKGEIAALAETINSMTETLATFADQVTTVAREVGEGLIGQAAMDKRKVLLEGVPSSSIRVMTGLSESTPQNILVLPVAFEGEAKGVIELASVERFNSTHLAFLDLLTESIGIVINTIEANMRTEELLKQSQSLAKQL
jgi:methyl-accepting chemotaxis protein